MDTTQNSTPLADSVIVLGPIAQNITFTIPGLKPMTIMFTGDNAEDISSQLAVFAPDATDVTTVDATDELKTIAADFSLAA